MPDAEDAQQPAMCQYSLLYPTSTEWSEDTYSGLVKLGVSVAFLSNLAVM